jgi:hypothetical protein
MSTSATRSLPLPAPFPTLPVWFPGAEQGQSPETIGYSLTDSPAGLAAWIFDHDTDSYLKISRAFARLPPAGGLTRDHIADNITLYWLTNTATTAERMYWESGRSAAAAAGQPPPEVSLPVAFTVFPGEIFQASRSWTERAYPKPHLLQRGRQGRPLRCLGRRAATVL